MNPSPAPVVAQPVKTCVDQRLEWLQRERDEIIEHIDWLKANRSALERIGIAPTRFWNQINFHNPKRNQILEIIKSFPGTWRKEIGDDAKTMDYKLEPGEGQVRIEIHNGELPPCCQVVEEWVDVPAQPATRMLRKVVKCPEPLPKTEPEMEAASAN